MVFESSAIVAIIAVSFAGLTALVQTLFHQMSQSRCTRLVCGCIECIRDPLDKEELEIIAASEASR